MLIACVQLNSGDDIKANLSAAELLVREAAAIGAKLVALPENSALMSAGKQEPYLEEAHPAVGFFSKLAAELRIWLLLGSVAVRDNTNKDLYSRFRGNDESFGCAESGKLKNRSLLFAADGAIAARYDKIHLFDVDIGSTDSSGGAYRESDRFSAGDKMVVADTPIGRLGLSVCYDVRFPLLYQKLARAGAEILCVPAAFTRLTGAAHWHVLLRARAIETGCYVIAPAQCGEHAGGRQTFGHAMIINPWGEIIAEAATEPCIIYADIDRGLVRSARRKIPAWKYD